MTDRRLIIYYSGNKKRISDLYAEQRALEDEMERRRKHEIEYAHEHGFDGTLRGDKDGRSEES